MTTYSCISCGDECAALICPACYEDGVRLPYETSIAYDPETRDYAMRLDGELVGFARNKHEADVTLNELIATLLAASARLAA